MLPDRFDRPHPAVSGPRVGAQAHLHSNVRKQVRLRPLEVFRGTLGELDDREESAGFLKFFFGGLAA